MTSAPHPPIRAEGAEGAAIICPKPSGGTWLGSGYQAATVHDSGGPLDGIRYVESWSGRLAFFEAGTQQWIFGTISVPGNTAR